MDTAGAKFSWMKQRVDTRYWKFYKFIRFTPNLTKIGNLAARQFFYFLKTVFQILWLCLKNFYSFLKKGLIGVTHLYINT